MYFLKCNNCGHPNEVISETLLFCNKCNKKLANNYRDWKKGKTEKTFEEFKLLMCISEKDINNKVSKKVNPKIKRNWINLMVIFAVLFAVAFYFKGKLLDYIKFGSHKTIAPEQVWITEQYGYDGLSVETPFKLKPEQVQIPLEEKAEIDSCANYSYWTSANFYIFISSIRFIPQIEAMINLRDFAKGSVIKLKTQPAVSDFVYNEGKIFYKNIPGYRQTGTFIRDKVNLEFISEGYLDGVKLYQIIIVYEADDKTAKPLVQRILSSIKIEPENISR
jgi:hypothetical protein